MGVLGVRSPETLNLNLFIPFVVVVLDVIMEEDKLVGANDIRRCGVEIIERLSADIVLVLDDCDPATGGGGGA